MIPGELSGPQWEALFEHLDARGYDVEGVLGRGGMGVVLKARDRNLGRDVAIKAIATNLHGDARTAARFNTEMQTMAKLRHPAIVQVYQGEVSPGGIPYFVMEYAPGPTLADALASSPQRYPARQAVRILQPIADALDYLHNPELSRLPGAVVHRDIKPANIILEPRGAMLTDFGISHVSDTSRVTQEGHLVGTLSYMAPEMFAPGDDLRAPEPTPASDNYAFALVALEMLTRTQLSQTMSDVAWRGPRPLDFLDDAPAAEVFRRALANDPSERYSSAGEFLRALERARPTSTRVLAAGEAQPGLGETKAVPSRRRRGAAAAVAVAAAAALAVGGAWVALRPDPTWAGPEAPIASAFPKLVGPGDGGNGAWGTTCRASEPEGSQRAKVSCTGPDVAYAVADYGSAEQRAAAVPTDGFAEFRSNQCAFTSGQLPGASADAFAVVMPQPRDRYAILIAGPKAEQYRLSLPVC